MDQIATGNYIAQKRRALNLTQEQLGEILNVSNKTISKWENGKCMPDYSIVEKLCETLQITISELMDGEDTPQSSARAYDEKQILDLLRRTQEPERQKQIQYGIMLIILGIACNAMSATLKGSNVKDFISGFLMGLSVVEMLAGIIIAGKKTIEK